MADQLYPITVPKWGIEMQEGTITGWQVAEGAKVSKGDDLIDIETDKIVNTLEAPIDGVVCKQLADEGATLRVGELLGVISTGQASNDDVARFVREFKPADASFGIDDAHAPAPAPERTVPSSAPSSASSEPRVSPVARRLAERLGVDLSQVQGTGRNGRISKADVEAAAQQVAPAQSAPVEPFSARRRAIAQRLVSAKQDIPHYYLSRELLVDRALAAKPADVSLNAIIVKAVAAALTKHPALNVHVTEQGVHKRATIDINIAVDTEQGLVAPLLQAVDQLELAALHSASAAIIERARNNQLQPGDLDPGGFTVSNLGPLGIDAFTAIINPPQAAILAVGTVRASLTREAGELLEQQRMTVTLSADHRVIDGADGARFLQTLADELNQIGG